MDKPAIRAIVAADAAPRAQKSNYPEPFASRMEGRTKRPLGNLFGLNNFGINRTSLLPGASTALHHRHSHQDEFVFVLEGTPTLVTDQGRVMLHPGMCAGFPAGGTAHHLINESGNPVVLLEVGDRTVGDTVEYPEDDLVDQRTTAGGWVFVHEDGSPYG